MAKNSFVVPYAIAKLRHKLHSVLPEKIEPIKGSIPQSNLISHITRVSFEITNTCNYASIHPECPVSCYSKAKTLDEGILYRVIDELSTYDYAGKIAFHRYNEPMLNLKRLHAYIAYTMEKIPKSKIGILTNGSYLDQDEMDLLQSMGVDSIMVSAYNKKEYYRLMRLESKLNYSVFYSALDDRESIYTREPVDSKKPCFATIRDITINCFGQVSICCYDWDNKVLFGDLKGQTLDEILSSDEFLRAHRELTTGQRNFEICRRCTTSR